MQAIKAVIKAKTYDNPFHHLLRDNFKRNPQQQQVDAYLNGGIC
jgi:hypothetical protein